VTPPLGILQQGIQLVGAAQRADRGEATILDQEQ